MFQTYKNYDSKVSPQVRPLLYTQSGVFTNIMQSTNIFFSPKPLNIEMCQELFVCMSFVNDLEREFIIRPYMTYPRTASEIQENHTAEGSILCLLYDDKNLKCFQSVSYETLKTQPNINTSFVINLLTSSKNQRNIVQGFSFRFLQIGRLVLPLKDEDWNEIKQVYARYYYGLDQESPPKKYTTHEQKMKKTLINQFGLKCWGCNYIPPDKRYLELDHINPPQSGGTDSIDNRSLLCPPCNKKKSDKLTLIELRRQNVRDNHTQSNEPIDLSFASEWTRKYSNADIKE